MSHDTIALEQEAAELRRVVEAPSEKERAAAKLREIEARIAEQKTAKHAEAAQERINTIRTELESLASSMDEAASRVTKAVMALEDAITDINEHYRKSMMLRVEAMALVDRFDLPTPALALASVPARRDLETKPRASLLDHLHVRPATERCEHAIRERRSFKEIAGSVGYKIIAAVGLKPFPPLTEQQRRVLAEREREAAEAARQYAGMSSTAQALKGAGETRTGF